NGGYPAPIHKSALAWYGPSAIHRRSWIFMDGLCWRGVPPAPGRLFWAGGRTWHSICRSCRIRRWRPARGFVAGVGANQWQGASPGEGWDVRELVNHIVSGNFWAGELARGKTIED